MHNFTKAAKAYDKKDFNKAISFYEKIDPKFKEVYLNLGSAYKGLNIYDKSYKAYTLAADTSIPFANGKYGQYSSAYNNLGLLHYALGNDKTALEHYSRALNIDPLNYDAIWNYGSALLRSSNCVDGWKHYEYRFKQPSSKFKAELPMWDGVSSGSSICVLAEQGIGDKIMFSRYLHLLSEKFTTIYVQCHPSLDCFYSSYPAF